MLPLAQENLQNWRVFESNSTTARGAQIVKNSNGEVFFNSGCGEHRYGSERQYRLHGCAGPLDHLLRRPPTRTDSNFGPPFWLILGPKIREIRKIREISENFETEKFSKIFGIEFFSKNFGIEKFSNNFGIENIEKNQKNSGSKKFQKFRDRFFSKFSKNLEIFEILN